MGLDNKVTAERYRTIKKYIEDYDAGVRDDAMVGKIFGVGVTVVCTIRNTRSYEEYLSKSSTYRRKRQKNKKKNKVVLPSSGLALIEIPPKKRQDIDGTAVMLGGTGAVAILAIIILFISCCLFCV